MALSLPPDGTLVACDIDPINTQVARRYWKEAGVDGIIDLRLGPAQETLQDLIQKDGENVYDMAFIDADKTEYEAYYETLLKLLKKGGILIADNVLWAGRVSELSNDDPNTAALRSFTLKVRDDERVSTSLLPIADGLLLAMKR